MTEEPKDAPLVRYSPAEAEIKIVSEEVKTALATIPTDSPDRLDLLKAQQSRLRPMRTAIEARRKELKADSLAWGRKVDAEAARLTGLILTVEDPIAKERQAIEDAREAEARALVEAEKARLQKIEDDKRAEQERQMAEERRKLAEERAEMERQRKAAWEAEQVRMAEVRANIEAEEKERRTRQAEADRIMREQQAQLAAERAKLEEAAKVIREAEERIACQKRAEQQAKERAEFERQTKELADREAAAAIERQRQDNIRRALEEEQEAARLEAAKPDLEKIRAFGLKVLKLAESMPSVTTPSMKEHVQGWFISLSAVAEGMRQYQVQKRTRKAVQA